MKTAEDRKKEKLFLNSLLGWLLFLSIFLYTGCQSVSRTPSADTPTKDVAVAYQLIPEVRPETIPPINIGLVNNDPAPSIRVASWNIKNLGQASKDSLREVIIAEVIKDFDVIAIQEITPKNDGAIKLIQKELNSKKAGQWRLLISSLTQPEKSDKAERIAILWNMKTIKLVHRGGFYPPSGRQQNYVRSPYRAHFITNWNVPDNFDFLLTVVHLTTGKTINKELDQLEELSDLLAGFGTVNPPTANPLPEPDVIICGDFNAGPPRHRARTQRPQDKHFVKTFFGYQRVAKGGADIGTMETGPAVNDNLLFKEPTFEDWAHNGPDGGGGVIAVRETIEKYAKAQGISADTIGSAEISDHRLVWARFWVTQDKSD